MVKNLSEKLRNRKKNNKGFTLVELIVVIVILAILAAILIPGLLKWIDKAKEEQYALEARNIYLATQAELAELYAKNSDLNQRPSSITGGSLNNIKDLADLTVDSVNVTYESNSWEINGLTTTFTSANGNKVTGSMTPNKTWTFTPAS